MASRRKMDFMRTAYCGKRRNLAVGKRAGTAVPGKAVADGAVIGSRLFLNQGDCC
jgi:hypothetical protein